MSVYILFRMQSFFFLRHCVIIMINLSQIFIKQILVRKVSSYLLQCSSYLRHEFLLHFEAYFLSL